MGNGSSQSIVLGPPRLQTSYSMHNGYPYQRGVPKYVHPQNRVLPKPILGQRLRSTDNGSILQTAGTIRGQRLSNGREENVDPEVMGILRRRSEMIEKENDCYHHMNLRSHRMFHSDPDITRRMSPDGYAVEEITDSYGNRRSSGGGAASRASKLKYKKKQRAPDPPPTGSSLPRQMERQCQNRNMEERRNQKNAACKCVNKSRAPQPPAIVIHPPPPPPLPSVVTTRTKISASPTTKTPNDQTTTSPSVTRAVECHESKPNYEKNIHPLEKWRNCRSTGDIRIDEQEESPSASRTTVFDSKKVSDSQSKLPSYLPPKPDPFQKEIQAVTKKIAESRQEKPPLETKPQSGKATPVKNVSDSKHNRPNSPPKFYFADTGVFKKENTSYKTDSTANGVKPSVNGIHSENHIKPPSNAPQMNSYQSQGPTKDRTTTDEVVPSLQRFSPGRQRFKPASRVSTPTLQQKAEMGWDELSRNIYNNKQDEDSDIDIRLRPVLPRKPLELPKFSPTEAWQALGSDGLSSNQSTSDDGPETVTPYKKKFSSGETDNSPRRISEVPYGLYDKRSNNNALKQRSMSDSHWTPRQDLLDDSDVSSDGSEEAVVPRIRTNPGEISTRFSLPTVMFSNMRPIGSDIKANGTHSYFGDEVTAKQLKKKTAKPYDGDHSMAPNFRKFLPKKNKYLSEEDIAVSDSNWTFGQQGLQKRGKQYSSDLMLSDKKKHELMMKSNFSDFLGDILVSKANHMRNQMKSSDSGNSNFSFYSTEGQIMYLPEKGGFVQENQCSPPTKGRVYDMRRRFDPNLERPNHWPKSNKKKPSPNDIDLGRKRDLELAKMLEDEVRKRRNKEKISIRQQLQKIKNLNTDDDDEDFDDEAYFTEPKSREESQSPFFQPGPSSHFAGSEFGYKPFRFSRLKAVTTTDSSNLSHWQSSPALLEDSVTKNAIRPLMKGHFSSSSVMSSPDPETWMQPTGIVDSWLQRQRNLEHGKKHLGSIPILEHSADESGRRMTVTDNANDGDVSSSPTPAPQKKKERRKTNIYKQLMDIVRKEEKHLRNAQRGNSEQDSRESSYSQRESSLSTSSESSSTSSYSYSDSSGSKNNGKNGVPANKEFHTSSYTNSAQNSNSSFQVAFVQPYTPSKSYRPVPFEVNNSGINGYRMPGLQEENKEVKAGAS